MNLKWARNANSSVGLAGTYIGPLAANLVGDERLEIIVVGGSTDGGVDGTVTVLDGTTGTIIWQVAPYSKGWGGVGMHTPFEIADLNKDGIPEIIISAVGGVLVLHGNDGSLYWRNPAAPSEEVYSAVCDIDGDGFPEVFANRGSGPYNGYDLITSLSYDGKILNQAVCWHPCWGGLTVGDANFDGRFELYQGDRSSDYWEENDTYKGGGFGLRALDAHTLAPLWNDPTTLCSTQCPILADMNGDGYLEVIVADQSIDGIAVYNSNDGSIISKGGTNMSSHSQPTLADVDNDGNLEFISCYVSQPIIWDLKLWKFDGTLPIVCFEPPKCGDVTGDGLLDMIAVSGTTVSIYDFYIGMVTFVQNITSPTWGGSAFTLVQDVDGDNLNELIVVGTSGIVSCYDTPAQSPMPRVRTMNQFYSERRCGAAQHVPPPNVNATVLFEDGFESGDFSAWSAAISTSGETATVSAALPHDGTSCAAFSSNGDSNFEAAYVYENFASRSELAARGYFRVYQSGITDNYDRFYFIRFKSGGNAGNDVAYAGWRMLGGALRWSLIVRNGTSYVLADSEVSPSLNKWYDVKLYWKADSTKGVGELRVDDVLVASCSGVNTAALGFVNVVRFGLAEVVYCAATRMYADTCMVSGKYTESVPSLQHYSLMTSFAGSGSVTKSPDKVTYAYGERVLLTAVPAAGWVFSGWKGVFSSSVNQVTVTINGTTWAAAIFSEAAKYTLTVSCRGSGKVTVNPYKQSYDYGEKVQLTAIPNKGWMFYGWSGDLNGSTNPTVVTMDRNKVVFAIFRKIR